MKRENYNGWYNRATWNVALWIGNDEGLYRAAVRAAKAVRGRLTSLAAREICQELFPSGQTPDGDKLADCHWPEIAADLREMAA
jgi:hypothetical protein